MLMMSLSSCQGRYLDLGSQEVSRQIIFNLNNSPDQRQEAVRSFLSNNQVDADMSRVLVGLAETERFQPARTQMSFPEITLELRKLIQRKIEQRRLLQITRDLRQN